MTWQDFKQQYLLRFWSPVPAVIGAGVQETQQDSRPLRYPIGAGAIVFNFQVKSAPNAYATSVTSYQIGNSLTMPNS